MKKTLLSVAVIAATVSVAHAEPAAWFAGNIGEVASCGSWDAMPTSGVTLEGNAYILNDAKSFKFTADESKSVSSSQNLVFSSSVAFKYAYGDFPEIDEGDKAGVTVYRDKTTTNFYVVGKVDGTNGWKNSSISAPANLDDEVSVTIMVTNGIDGTHAVYSIGNPASTFDTLIVTPSAFRIVDYSGCGVIKALTGGILLKGYPIPGNFVIATEAGNAWAARFGYAQDKLAAILINNATVAYGRTAAESCILGVATNEEITASIDDTDVAADKLKFKVQLDPTKIIAGHNVQFQLKKDATGVGSAQTDLVFNPDFAAGKYSIVAYIDGADKEISVSKTMGVKTAEGFGASAAAGFLAVPYTGAEGDIAISNLFKKAMLVNGDQLHVFDSETAGWKSFKFNGTAWEGVQKNEVTPNPATTTIKRGQAFKLTRPDAGSMPAPVYLGYVSTAAATVSLPSKKYELVAKPDGSALELSKLGADDWAAKVDVNAALPTAMYKNKDGWKVITYSGGVPTESPAENIEGPFFLMNRGSEARDIDL